jgi:hypothetical protein
MRDVAINLKQVFPAILPKHLLFGDQQLQQDRALLWICLGSEQILKVSDVLFGR